MTPIGPLEIGETKAIRFNFDGEADAAAILSSPTVTCVVVEGADPSASSVLSGVSYVDGLQVVQIVHNGVAGCTYKLVAFASDNTGLRHRIPLRLQVVSG